MKKIIKSRLFIVIITTIIVASGTLYAANKYQASEVVYKASDGTTTDVNTALDNIYKSCKKEGNSVFKIGDYVSMIPESTSYTISKSLTGYSKEQTINPSELNLWRVIKINDDNTIDMVSEYVSSTSVYFYGPEGYKKFVGTLNMIAKQYENPKYTIGSRCVGYNGQTENLINIKRNVKVSTGFETIEKEGGGDQLYTKDIELIRNSIGTFQSYKINSSTPSSYWLAARQYYYESDSNLSWTGLTVDGISSTINGHYFEHCSAGIGCDYANRDSFIRPIVTLKSKLNPTNGIGSKENPYILK